MDKELFGKRVRSLLEGSDVMVTLFLEFLTNQGLAPEEVAAAIKATNLTIDEIKELYRRLKAWRLLHQNRTGNVTTCNETIDLLAPMTTAVTTLLTPP